MRKFINNFLIVALATIICITAVTAENIVPFSEFKNKKINMTGNESLLLFEATGPSPLINVTADSLNPGKVTIHIKTRKDFKGLTCTTATGKRIGSFTLSYKQYTDEHGVKRADTLSIHNVSTYSLQATKDGDNHYVVA